MPHDMPSLGFGTWGRWGAEGQAAIEYALAAGYRHLDTAQSYDSERPCGDALAGSGLSRDDVFVTTKITAANLGPGKLVPSLRRSLEALRLDRVDLTLIHWPSPSGEVPLPVYMDQLAEAQEAGMTRHIGVSNFTIALLKETRRHLGGKPILTNQVEVNPFMQNRKLVDYCRAAGIIVTCYRPIAGGGMANADPVLQAIGEKYGANPVQVALAFLLAVGHVAIPASGRRERIRSNLEALKLELDDADIDAITDLDRGHRHIDPAMAPDWD